MTLRFSYDPQANAAYLQLGDGKIVETEQVKEDIIIDYDATGRVLGLEFLHARERLTAEMLALAMPE
jgi:uncharacterized protein YuzE